VTKSPVSIPLSLFVTDTLEEAPPPLRERIRSVQWSYSRRNTLEQCPRKYYFDYYGTHKKQALKDPQKALLQSLKPLQNRYERTGEIAHKLIADYFRAACEGLETSTDDLMKTAKHLFAEDVQSAQPRLLELFYNQAVALDLCSEAEQRMLAALENFSRHPHYEKIRNRGTRSGARIEQLFHLKFFPCRVTGIVDFAARTKAGIGVVDWKTGKKEADEDESLQLAIYACWGAEQFACPAEKVNVFKAFLGSGDLVRFSSDSVALENARVRVLQDVERMVEVHPYGSGGRMHAFTACAQKQVCLLCPYVAACTEGKECLYG
jgi:RecB family exonuclease